MSKAAAERLHERLMKCRIEVQLSCQERKHKTSMDRAFDELAAIVDALIYEAIDEKADAKSA